MEGIVQKAVSKHNGHEVEVALYWDKYDNEVWVKYAPNRSLDWKLKSLKEFTEHFEFID